MVTSGAGCLRGGGTCAGRLWWLGVGGDGGAAGIAVARWWGGVGQRGGCVCFLCMSPWLWVRRLTSCCSSGEGLQCSVLCPPLWAIGLEGILS